MALYDAAVSIPLVTVDGDGFLANLGSGTFYDLVVTPPAGPPIVVVADLPVEWDGSFDLLFQWFVVQLVDDELLFTWIVTPDPGIQNGDLPFTWNVLEAPADLLFTWVVIPAGLLDAYELDPQRPYGRVTKP